MIISQMFQDHRVCLLQLFIRSPAIRRTCGGQEYRFDAGLLETVLLIKLVRFCARGEDRADVCAGEDEAHIVGFRVTDAAVVGAADIAAREDVPDGDAVREQEDSLILLGHRKRITA